MSEHKIGPLVLRRGMYSTQCHSSSLCTDCFSNSVFPLSHYTHITDDYWSGEKFCTYFVDTTLWIYEAILWRIQNTEYCALYAYVLRYSLNILKCHFKGIIQLYFKILTGLYIVRPLYTPQMITWISLCDTFNKDWYGADQTQPAWLGIHSLMWPASDLSELSFEGKSFFINGCFTGASVILPSARSTIQKDQPFSPVFN